MSWKAEVRVGNDDKFYSNDLRFSTKEEAEAYGRDLMSRWMATVAMQAVEDDAPVNYNLAEGRPVARSAT